MSLSTMLNPTNMMKPNSPSKMLSARRFVLTFVLSFSYIFVFQFFSFDFRSFAFADFFILNIYSLVFLFLILLDKVLCKFFTICTLIILLAPFLILFFHLSNTLHSALSLVHLSNGRRPLAEMVKSTLHSQQHVAMSLCSILPSLLSFHCQFVRSNTFSVFFISLPLLFFKYILVVSKHLKTGHVLPPSSLHLKS